MRRGTLAIERARAVRYPRPRGLDLRRERRAACAPRAARRRTGRPAGARACENPAGTDAAGWPVEFQSTPNGTQPLSHCHVANAPRPSITCAGTAGAAIIGISSTSKVVPQPADPPAIRCSASQQPSRRSRSQISAPGRRDGAGAALEPLRALDLDDDVANPAQHQRDDHRHVAGPEVEVALDHRRGRGRAAARRCRAARRASRRRAAAWCSGGNASRVGDPQRPRRFGRSMPGRHHVEHQRRVGDRARQAAEADPVAAVVVVRRPRHAPGVRLEPEQPAARGRDADRAGPVGRHRRRAPAPRRPRPPSRRSTRRACGRCPTGCGSRPT